MVIINDKMLSDKLLRVCEKKEKRNISCELK